MSNITEWEKNKYFKIIQNLFYLIFIKNKMRTYFVTE